MAGIRFLGKNSVICFKKGKLKVGAVGVTAKYPARDSAASRPVRATPEVKQLLVAALSWKI